MIKIADIDREVLDIFWTTWGISMKLLGKMWLTIIIQIYIYIKKTKTPGFHLVFKRYIFRKSTRERGQIDPTAVLGLI